MSALPPPPPPGRLPPPSLPPPGAGYVGSGDEWQLPGDRWLPGGYRAAPGRPGWQVDPVGWQQVAAPAPDPLVPHDGFGDWFSKVFAVVGRSWRSLVPLYLCALPLDVAIAALVLPLRSTTAVTRLTANGRITLDGGRAFARFGAVAAVALGSLVIGTVIRGAAAWLVTHDAAGRRSGLGAAVRFGLRRFWAFVGWSLVAGLVTAAGFVACVVPGIWLAVVFGSVLTGVVAFERGGVWHRCFALGRGAWWRLFGRLLVLGLLLLAFTRVVSVVTGPLVTTDTDLALLGLSLVRSVLGIPVKLLSAGAAVVTYAERRHATGHCTTGDLLADLHADEHR